MDAKYVFGVNSCRPSVEMQANACALKFTSLIPDLQCLMSVFPSGDELNTEKKKHILILP